MEGRELRLENKLDTARLLWVLIAVLRNLELTSRRVPQWILGKGGVCSVLCFRRYINRT